MRRGNRFLFCLSGVLFAFLYLPIIGVIVGSFNATRYGVAWSGFTTQWYRSLLANEAALAAAKNTLVLAGISTVISTILGTLLGYGIARCRDLGSGWCERLLYLPVCIPDIVMGASLVLFYSFSRNLLGLFELGLGTMIAAHVTFQIPFVTIIVRSRMAGLDSVLEEAAYDLGANRSQAFWRITFPLMFPGVLAGALFAFTLSLDDFVISYFTSGPGTSTLPILIYSSVKRGITPDVNALSVVILVLSIAAIVTVTLLQRGRLR